MYILYGFKPSLHYHVYICLIYYMCIFISHSVIDLYINSLIDITKYTALMFHII